MKILCFSFQVVHRFKTTLNIVQATINQSKTVLGYICKQTSAIDSENDSACATSPENIQQIYKAFFIELRGEESHIHDLNIERSKQLRIQFLYKAKDVGNKDRFLLLAHQECKFYFRFFSSFIELSENVIFVFFTTFK